MKWTRYLFPALVVLGYANFPKTIPEPSGVIFRRKCSLIESISPFLKKKKNVVARLHLEGVSIRRTLFFFFLKCLCTRKHVEISAILLNQAFMQWINVQLFSVNIHKLNSTLYMWLWTPKALWIIFFFVCIWNAITFVFICPLCIRM